MIQAWHFRNLDTTGRHPFEESMGFFFASSLTNKLCCSQCHKGSISCSLGHQFTSYTLVLVVVLSMVSSIMCLKQLMQGGSPIITELLEKK